MARGTGGVNDGQKARKSDGRATKSKITLLERSGKQGDEGLRRREGVVATLAEMTGRLQAFRHRQTAFLLNFKNYCHPSPVLFVSFLPASVGKDWLSSRSSTSNKNCLTESTSGSSG